MIEFHLLLEGQACAYSSQLFRLCYGKNYGDVFFFFQLGVKG